MRRKKLRLLRLAFKTAGADKIIGSFLLFFMLAALLIFLIDPAVTSYVDAIWYCFAAVTTIGFGDIGVTTIAARIITIVLPVYSIAVIAIFTAVITSFFMEVTKLRANDSARAFLDDLEHLPELSKEELEELSQRVKKFNKHN